jgi:raffinose/stachyose/melibiose transport system permease protein
MASLVRPASRLKAPKEHGRAPRRGAPGEPRRVAYLYLLPALAIYVLFIVFPLFHAVYLSFFNWNGITQGTWTGLSNYVALIQDPLIQESFTHSLVFIVFYSFIPVAVGLFLAATLTRVPIRGLPIFRTVLFLPQTISMVVIAVAWRWMYNPNGTINALLGAVGLGSLERGWLGDFTFALPALGLVGSWVMYGLTMILFIAGISRISPDLYDAAKVDGAGPIQEFFAVTLPGLRNEMQIGVLFTMIAALRAFDLTYVATLGGPGHSTTVPALWVFTNAFQNQNAGYAAAIGVTLAVIILVVSFTIMRLFESRD